MKNSSVFDSFILLPLIGLMGVSLFIIGSVAADFFTNQLISFTLGLIFYFIFSGLDYRIWTKFSKIIYFSSLLLLISLFFMPVIRGAHRWLDLGFFLLQPSEIIKPFIIIFFANMLSKKDEIKLNFLMILLLFFLPIVFLIFQQPDLGNVLVYVGIFVSLLIVSGLHWFYFPAGAFLFAVFLPLVWAFIKNYQRLRLVSFLNPYLDPRGTGYNAIQAMIAVGSGGLMGVGLGRGTQSRLLFLPEYQTDFIFSSIAEALGFVGGLFIIFLYFALLTKILTVTFKAEDRFGRYIAIGVFAQLFIQIFINIGMNLGILPITGITLPLISYGGSSVISTFIGLGLVTSISRMGNIKPLVIR